MTGPTESLNPGAGFPAETDLRGSVPLRYVGFRQSGLMRVYRFERFRPGHPAETLSVTADMSLFRKHSVAIQEGPGICLRALGEAPLAAGLSHALTDQHLLAYLTTRRAGRSGARHIPAPYPRATV